MHWQVPQNNMIKANVSLIRVNFLEHQGKCLSLNHALMGEELWPCDPQVICSYLTHNKVSKCLGHVFNQPTGVK